MKVQKVFKSRKNPTDAKSSMRSNILLARERLRMAKAQKNKENKVFEVPGFFMVSSPIKKAEISRSHASK